MQKLFRKLARKISLFLQKWTYPMLDELVMNLILNVSSLEIPKGCVYELNAIKGTCGTFKLTGNGLPVFEYTVFDKKLMEFVKVRVEVSKPDRIQYIPAIEDPDRFVNGTFRPKGKRHGEVIEVTPAYQQPFLRLSYELFRYFPFVSKQLEKLEKR